MSDERELERHSKIVEQINNAQTREDLPNIGLSTLAGYLASNVYFNNRKVSQVVFSPLVDEIVKYGTISNEKTGTLFIKIIIENYPEVSEEEIIEKYNKIASAKRIGYVLEEINLKNIKLDEINKQENYNKHKSNMILINQTFEIRDLPKVGLSELNKRLTKAVNDNDFNINIKTSEIKELTNAYLNKLGFEVIDKIVENICSKENISIEDKRIMKEQIINALSSDETIDYIVEEIHAKEKRKEFIYKNDHELTMDAIKQAHRISQLPPNLTFSTLTSYLNGNTTIYSNDDRIKAEHLKHLTELLLEGYKWEDQVISNEIRKIVTEVFPDKEDAYILLLNKLSNLPKTYYFVDEINYSLSRQKEFIGNSCSNVNVYFIPNEKSPIEGGRFYNCYINRVDNLDLSQILPLNLDEIVPPKMDIDSIEWYVQEKYDDTFKMAGGIILNRDETIGNVNVFRPNDNKIGISIEEKEKLDKIEDLDLQIQYKEEKLAQIESELKKKTEQSTKTETEMKKIIDTYEKKVLLLQMEMLKSIETLKQGFDIDNETPLNTNGVKRG